MLCMKPVITIVAKLKFPAICGRITAMLLFRSPHSTIILNTGMIVENTGNIRLATMRLRISSLPLK